MAVCIMKQVCDQPPASDVIRTLPVFAASQIATRIWRNSCHVGRPTYTVQSLLWKGADSSCWGRTQHNGGDSISVGANVYSAGGRLYFVHTFAGGRHYPGILFPMGDFLWGGSITQHRRPCSTRCRTPSSVGRRSAANAPTIRVCNIFVSNLVGGVA